MDLWWSYKYTRFEVNQLQLHRLLILPQECYVRNRNWCTSEEALILTLAKLAHGFTFIVSADFFGEATDSHLSKIYKYTINNLDNKPNSISHGNSAQCWTAKFPEFALLIQDKLSQTKFGGHHFNDFFLSDWIPGLQSDWNNHTRKRIYNRSTIGSKTSWCQCYTMHCLFGI